MVDGISRRPERSATSAALAALLALAGGGMIACGGSRAATRQADAAEAEVTLPLAQVFVLEESGTPPADTSVTMAAGQPHTVLLLHGPPDNVVFASVRFGAGAFKADTGAAVTVTLKPRPGVYGLDLAADAPIAGDVLLTFKYARFFAAPAAARTRYGSEPAFERALRIGRLKPDGAIALLASTRPAFDNLEAIVRDTGSYVVAAPR